jgi:sulfane dehydrogenase subunit SoxC
MKKTQLGAVPVEAAGNGLLDRRLLLRTGALVGFLPIFAENEASAEPSQLAIPEWSKVPGSPFVGYGQPSKFEASVVRIPTNPPNVPGAGAAWAPLHRLHGTITPNGLHFERSHSGIPDIDPDVHRLLIHGLVKRPLIFTLDALARYPMESRITLMECGGNSLALYSKQPVDGNAQTIHGLASCAEWTGVKLSTLLDEAGVQPNGGMATRRRCGRGHHDPQHPDDKSAR